MKSFFIILFSFCIFTVNSQSTEKFIRIVGNASLEKEANGATLQLIVAEVLPNEYKQVKFKSFEEVKAEVIKKLAEINIPESSVKQAYKQFNNRYDKSISETYEIKISDIKLLSDIRKIECEGATFQDLKFTFADPGLATEEILAIKAIEDAKAKAQYIALKSGFKVGKILNIEDFSSGSCLTIPTKQESSHKLVYRLNITFELL